MRSIQHVSFLPVMMLASVWMVGCAGTQKPKMAPANTALGTIQRAEVQLKAGQKAQASRQYKVALASHLKAVDMAESIANKYPKDPLTATFQKNPTLGKQPLDTIKNARIPLLRKQALISEDIVGWAFVEAEQLTEERTRHYAYVNIFNALLYARDFENAQRVLGLMKDDYPSDRLAKLQKRLDNSSKSQKRMGVAKTPLVKRQNVTALSKAIYAHSVLLDQQKYEDYLNKAAKEPDALIRHKLYDSLLNRLRHHPDDLKAFKGKKQLASAAFLSRIQSTKYPYSIRFYLGKILRAHKRFGFESKSAALNHILSDVEKGPDGSHKIYALLAIAGVKDGLKSGDVKKLFMRAGHMLLANNSLRNKASLGLFRSAIYGLNRKDVLDSDALVLIEKLFAKAPNPAKYQTRNWKKVIVKAKTSLGQKITNVTLDALPEIKTEADLNIRNTSKMNRILKSYVLTAKGYGKASQVKEIKSLMAKLKASEKMLKPLTQLEARKGTNAKNLLDRNQRAQLALSSFLKDHKAVMAQLDVILAAKNGKRFFFDASIRAFDEYAAGVKLSASKRAKLETKILEVISMDEHGFSLSSTFRGWLTSLLVNENIAMLDRVLSQYKSYSQSRVLDQLARLYLKLEKPPAEGAVAKWLVAKSTALTVKKYSSPRLKNLIEICQRPKATCLGQINEYMKSDKITEYSKGVVVERLARGDQFTLAREYLGFIKDPVHRVVGLTAILNRELNQHGHFDKIKPELNQVIDSIDSIGKLSKLEKERRWRRIFNLFAFNDQCIELNALLVERKAEEVLFYRAATVCARYSLYTSSAHPAAVLKMTQKVTKPSQRRLVLIQLIKRLGVVNTAKVNEVLLDVAASKSLVSETKPTL